MAPFNYTFPNDGYVAPIFHNTPPIESIHEGSPRFGHTSNFSVLVNETSTPAEKREYVSGLFIASILVLALLVVWALVLLALKCSGRHAVGCASGAAFRYPPRPTTAAADGEEAAGAGGDKLASGGGGDDDSSSSTESHGEDDGCLKKNVDGDDAGSSASIGTHSTVHDEQSPPPTPTKSPPPAAAGGEEAAAAKTTEAIDTSVVIDVDGSGSGVKQPSRDAADRASKGQSMEQPLEEEKAEEIAAWRADVARIERRARRTRIAFLFSGLMVLIFSALFIAYGVGFMRQSVVSVQRSLVQAEDVILYSANITRDFIAGATTAEEARDNFNETFLLTTENACVAAAAEGFGVDRLDDAISDVVASLGDLKELFVHEATNLYRDLNMTAVLIGDVRGYTDYSKWAFVVSAIITIVFDVLVVILMMGVVFAWCGWDWWVLRCTRTWVVLPIMCVMVVLIWIFACVFLVGAVTASDFCYNSPDQNAVYILDQFKDVFSSLTYGMILYYITGCAADDHPAQFLASGYFKAILHAIDVGHNLILNLTLAPGAVFESCGANETAMDAAAHNLDHVLHLVAELFLRVISIFQCSSFNPIYVGFVHSALCYNGVTGLNWMFWSLFVVCVFSMIMVTLRVSWIDIQGGEGGGEGGDAKGEQGRRCGGGCTSCGCIRGDRAGTNQEEGNLDEGGVAT